MNKTTAGGALLMFAGVAFFVMAVEGSWRAVWKALVPSSKVDPSKASSNLASFDPGGVITQGGSGTSGSGGAPRTPGSAPAPLPGGGSYSRLVRGSLRFAGVDQGIDFTGPGQVLAPLAGVARRVQRSGSGWPGEGAFELLQLDNGHNLYLAEDFRPTLSTGQRVRAGDVIGVATGSGRAPGIEVGWADAQGHPLSPLYPNPHSPKPSGRSFDAWIRQLSQGSVQGSGVLA